MQISDNSFLSRYEWAPEQVRKLLPHSGAKIVADIGAGDARLRATIADAGGEWHGYDLKPSTDIVCKWNVEQPADPVFPKPTVVLMLDVVEHLGNPWRAFQNIADHLLPGGHLILTTPNPLWSRSRIWALAHGTPACFTQADLDLNHHVFTPWPHIVERLLLDCGLTVIRYDTLDGRTQWPRGPVTLRYPARFALACTNKLIESRDPSACGMSYGLVARKTVH
jgi:SAM-dependent methyltransferase